MTAPGINRRKSPFVAKSKARAANKAIKKKRKTDKIIQNSGLVLTKAQKKKLVSNPNANVSLSRKKLRLMGKQMKSVDKEMEDVSEQPIETVEVAMEVEGSNKGTTLGGPKVSA